MATKYHRLTDFLGVLVFAIPIMISCRDDKGNDPLPGCPAGGDDWDDWVNSHYDLMEGNPTCEDDPIEDPFQFAKDTFGDYGGVDADMAVGSYMDVLRAWSNAGADVGLWNSNWSLTGAQVDHDGENHVFMYDGEKSEDSKALATAYLTWDWSDDDKPEDFDCDIVVYSVASGKTIRWDTGSDAGLREHDLVLTLAHEFGHCLGLGHYDAPLYECLFRRSVMKPTAPAGLDFGGLGNLDMEALIFLYGED